MTADANELYRLKKEDRILHSLCLSEKVSFRKVEKSLNFEIVLKGPKKKKRTNGKVSVIVCLTASDWEQKEVYLLYSLTSAIN